MYLFSRQTRLAGGNGRRGIEWAVEMCERVNQITELDVSLWGRMFSPGFGTIAFTSHVRAYLEHRLPYIFRWEKLDVGQ